jgi:hypothetical protein
LVSAVLSTIMMFWPPVSAISVGSLPLRLLTQTRRINLRVGSVDFRAKAEMEHPTLLWPGNDIASLGDAPCEVGTKHLDPVYDPRMKLMIS